MRKIIKSTLNTIECAFCHEHLGHSDDLWHIGTLNTISPGWYACSCFAAATKRQGRIVYLSCYGIKPNGKDDWLSKAGKND